MSGNTIAVRNIGMTYPGGVEALKGVNLDIPPGELTTLLGPSGCGKTTLLKIIAGLITPVDGDVVVHGKTVDGPGPERALVFQDFALLPWATVMRNVAFGLELRGLAKAKRQAIAQKYLKEVGLAGFEDSYPHELSGGMRQRVMIAMALSCNPNVLIADEPTTALDVTIQAQILNLMRDLKSTIGAAIILITHDLGVVAEMAERVVVMYAGRKVEEAPVDQLFGRPLHPYTYGLMGSVPRLNEAASGERRRLQEIEGMVPSLNQLIVGCAFAPRCSFATDRCRQEAPVLEDKADGHLAACWESDRLRDISNG